MICKENNEELSYLNLLKTIISDGSKREDRTGVGTMSLFGTQLRFSLEDSFPLLTTKKMFIKGIVEELLFFLRGDTDTKILESKGVNIWKGNTSRDYLDNRGLSHFAEGEMGKGYGFQWRRFGETSEVKGVDQIAEIINSIKSNPYSRRHIVSAWNPNQRKESALDPCHMIYQFYVDNGYLSCQWFQRSVDAAVGLPFNIASYALLTNIIAKVVKLKPKEVIFAGGDTHVYLNHVEQVEKQCKRNCFKFPNIEIKKELNSIKDIENLVLDDFIVKEYNHHKSIKMPMNA